jgi:3-oxoacyl-[acyl-carrier protein] reductase
MSEPTPLPCSTVVVSGGSRGLGLAMVSDLLDRGVRVGTFSRSGSEELDALAEERPDTLFTDRVDSNDPAAVGNFLSSAQERLGPLDGLVTNAAVGQDSLLVHTAPDRVEQIISTNLTSSVLLTRAFLRKVLARSGTGRIVNITSICARRGYPGLVAYAATKGGMESVTRTLARELRGRVLVNAIAPGFFASEMSSVLGTEELEAIVRRTPSGRLAEPSDILPLLRTLLLEQTNLNGQVLTVDGGGSV